MKKLLVALILGLFLLFGGGGGDLCAFDQLPGAFPEWADVDETDQTPDMTNFVIHVITRGTAEVNYPKLDDRYMADHWTKGTGFFHREGSGFYVGKDLIVTAAHVVVPDHALARDPDCSFMMWEAPVSRVLSQLIYVNGYTAEILYSNIENDLAILRVTCPHPFKALYQPTPSVCFFTGEALAVMVMTRTEEGEMIEARHELRYGTLEKHRAITVEGLEHTLPWFSLNDITIKVLIIPGDSGSPLFAFIDGKPHIVGINRAGGPEHLYAARIDPLIPILEGEGVKIFREQR